jgi:hypothetical protein
MVAETELTFTSARENPHDAYAEYMGELPIFSLTKDMEKLSLIDYQETIIKLLKRCYINPNRTLNLNLVSEML